MDRMVNGRLLPPPALRFFAIQIRQLQEPPPGRPLRCHLPPAPHHASIVAGLFTFWRLADHHISDESFGDLGRQAFFKAKGHEADEIAAKQAWLLKNHLPLGTKLRISDVKELFHQMRDQV